MNFRETLAKRPEEIERPPLAPKGTYRFRINKQPVTAEISDGAWTTLSFPSQAQEALTVDADEMENFGQPSAINLRVQFMFPSDPAEKANYDRTEFALRTFLFDHIGLDGNMTIGEAIDTCVGSEFIGTLEHRADKRDPAIVYAEIRKTMPVS